MTGTPTPTIRTDPAPLVRVFPALGSPREVRWTGEIRGGENQRVTVPGPSTVRLRAVVRPQSEVFRSVVGGYRWDATAAPDIDAALSRGLDLSGPWSASAGYSAHLFAEGGAGAAGQVLMNEKSGVLYLEADIS